MKRLLDYLLITIGSAIVAIGLELILAPNNLIDGGVTGISIMVSHLYGVPKWIIFLAINIPSLFVVGKYMGKKFVCRTVYSVIVTSLSIMFFEPFPAITTSEVLIVIYGGLLLGVGIGLVVKSGGAIDGSEMLAIWLHKKYHMPISRFLLLINAVILSGAAFVFSLEKAMFSIAVFYIVTRTIDFILDGVNQGKSVMIISDNPDEVAQQLIDELGIKITFIDGEGGYSGEKIKLIYCITDRFMYPKLKDSVLSVDPDAILEASFVSETAGITRKSLFSSDAKAKAK